MVKLRNIPLDGSHPELFQPVSNWMPYTGPLPRLSGVGIGIDTETRDDGLSRQIGPGWVFDLCKLCGVSVAFEGGSIYVPVRHPDTECRPVQEVLEWLECLFTNCDCHFFNAGYDLPVLWKEGLRVWPRRLHDAHLSSVMLNENHLSYSLDACCARAGIPGKDQGLLEEAARSYGVHPKSGLWRMPGRYIGPYAEQDAAATLQLSLKNMVPITEQFQLEAYQTEIDLVRVVFDMRDRGIPVDEGRAEQAIKKIEARRDAALEEIGRISGYHSNMHSLRSPDAVGRIFESAGVICPRTPSTNKPSVTKTWLNQLEHPLGNLVRSARRFDDLSEKFIKGYILDNLHRGRIHAEIHQLRDSEGGTRSHRLSYSNPPLHQMPARPDRDDPPENVELVREVRSVFGPEDGEIWCAPDYAGQEPRFLVHLAAACKMPGGEAMAQRYRDNPRLDYHQTVADILGWKRAQAKDTNQGLAYGMGLDKLARTLHCSVAEAEEKLATYHSGMPYVRKLTEFCSNLAKQRGWIKLIDGARCHFDAWQPAGSRREDIVIVGEDAARHRWPEKVLERAFTFKALNRLCQGGAARQMKRAMVACHKEGIKMLVTMHDELGASISTRREALVMQDCMIDAVKLQVPMLVDLELGEDWGHAKHTLEEVRLS